VSINDSDSGPSPEEGGGVLAGAPSAVLDAAWRLHPQVSVRPERFGALLYHFGTRRLSFLKSPTLLRVVQSLDSQPTARAACVAAGVGPVDLPVYAKALETLAAGSMITVGGTPPDDPPESEMSQ
jgi:mycofactocin biosynthesis protein MftB